MMVFRHASDNNNRAMTVSIYLNSREMSRVTLIPMVNQLPVATETSANLRKLQAKSGSSVGTMLRLGNVVLGENLDTIRQEILKVLSVSCQVHERLAQSYALELACTFTVSSP